MSVWTTFKLAFRALWRNLVRTILTMLGIVCGIGAVIAMVAIGQGAQESVKQVFTNLGTNVLQVLNGSQSSFGAAGGLGSRQSLTWADLEAMQSGEIATIKWVAPLLSTKAQLASEEQNWNTTVYGTTAVWFKIRNWAASKGEVFDEDTGNSSAKVCVIGQTVSNQLFPGNSPVGQTVRIQGQPYTVLGVLDSKGAGPMGDMDDLVVLPVKTYEQKLSKGLAKYIPGQLVVSMTNDDEADHTMAALTALLRDRHKLDAAQDDDFRIRNPAEFAQAQHLDPARDCRWRFAVRRGHRGHEHHAGQRDRANPRDRHPHGRRCAADRRDDAVPRRVARAGRGRWLPRDRPGLRRRQVRLGLLRVQDVLPSLDRRDRVRRRRWCRRGVRSISRDPGVTARSDHGSEVRDMKSRIVILCTTLLVAPLVAHSQPSQTPPQAPPSAGSGSGSGSSQGSGSDQAPTWTLGVQDVTAEELGASGKVTLSMARAVELAVKNHPTLRIQVATAEAAFGKVDQARVTEHPTVTLSASPLAFSQTQVYASSKFNPVTGQTGGASGGFLTAEQQVPLLATANWRIYDFGQTRANVAAAQANADATVAGAASSALDIKLGVEIAYLQAIAMRRLTIVAEATVASETNHTDQARRFVAAGQYDPIQLSQAEARLANARSALAQAQSNEATALAALRAAIGWVDPTTSLGVDPRWPTPSTQVPDPLPQLLDAARKVRPDIVQLDKQIIASDFSLEAAHAERRPILSASASLGWDPNGIQSPDSWHPQPTWNAGLTLSWLLWDGGKSSADVHVAQGNLDIAIATRDQLLVTLVSTLENARAQIVTNKANVQASNEAVVAAQAQLKLSEARYAQGLGSQIELADSMTAVTTAAGSLVTAEYQLATAWATLERALAQ
jgi:outer membrane protein TolC